METLFLILGTGQNVLRDFDNREYKTTKYCLQTDNVRRTVESPFVGEAIVKLHGDRFNKIYIFGTNSSMWETLYMHINQNVSDNDDQQKIKDNFYKIWNAIHNNNLDKQDNLLQIMNEALSNYFDVSTECIILPVGEDEKQLWKIFEIIQNLKIDNTKVSFDITHGLRFQPYVLLFSLFYLNSITDGKVKLGSVFYGALELKNEKKYQGIAPVFEFNIFSEIHNWTTASEVFRKYKDTEQIAILLKKNEGTKELSEIINNYSFAYNSNSYKDIIKLSQEIVNQFEYIDNVPIPFTFLIPKIKEFAEEINNQKSNTKKLLKIAQQQLRYHNYSSAIIALYEAIVEEYRKQKQIDDKRSAHNKFSKDLDQLTLKIISNNIQDFYFYLRELKQIRNLIAHLKESSENSRIKYDIETIRKLVNYFSGKLEKARFS